MKKIFTTLALAIGALGAFAQTAAPDWTATDCDGASHTLYQDLDDKKIVVMVWVMPCASCIDGAKAAYNAVTAFNAANPGMAKLYIFDDAGNTSCNTLSSWVQTNVASGLTLFGNSGNVVDEADFGGSGMPHVVIAAEPARKIFYNKKNNATYDETGITTALNNAKTALNVAAVNGAEGYSITPNPVQKDFTINYAKPVYAVSVTSLSGQIVKTVNYATGVNNPQVDLSGIATGIYNVKFSDKDGKSATVKIVKQ
jgi:hypothetical protein